MFCLEFLGRKSRKIRFASRLAKMHTFLNCTLNYHDLKCVVL